MTRIVQILTVIVIASCCLLYSPAHTDWLVLILIVMSKMSLFRKGEGWKGLRHGNRRHGRTHVWLDGCAAKPNGQ